MNINRHGVQKRLNRLIEWILDDATCRWVGIDQYFGGNQSSRCGSCDICVANRVVSTINIAPLMVIIHSIATRLYDLSQCHHHCSPIRKKWVLVPTNTDNQS